MRVSQPPAESPHVVHIAATANGAHWMHQMLRDLRARGYRSTAIIGGRGGTLEARLTRDGIPYHVLELDVFASRNAVAAARRLLQLARLLRDLKADVVQYHLFPSIIVGRLAAWMADVPVRSTQTSQTMRSTSSSSGWSSGVPQSPRSHAAADHCRGGRAVARSLASPW